MSIKKLEMTSLMDNKIENINGNIFIQKNKKGTPIPLDYKDLPFDIDMASIAPARNFMVYRLKYRSSYFIN